MKLLKEFTIENVLFSWDCSPKHENALNRLIVRFGSKYGLIFKIPEEELFEVLEEEKVLKKYLIDHNFIEEEGILKAGDLIKYRNSFFYGLYRS